MKNLSFYLSLFLMVIAIASCGNKNKTEDKDDDEEVFELEKGDIRVILEVSQSDVIDVLADHCPDPVFKKSLAEARNESEVKAMNFVDVFAEKWRDNANGRSLASIFANMIMRDKVNPQSTDEEVIKVLKEEARAATENAENVLRNRLDNLGIDYNLQLLNGHGNLIMAEIARPKDKDRLLKILGSNANIEFWETYNGNELYPILQSMMDDYTAKMAVEITQEETEAMDTSDDSDLAAAIAKREAEEETSRSKQPRLMLYNAASVVVGLASVHDTAYVNRMIQSEGAQVILRSISTGEARLVWGAKPAEGYSSKESIFELYALKVTDPSGRAPLEGDVITSAKAELNYSKPVVSINMNTQGTRVWAELTKKNLKRSIAIVMDDVVYTAPTIQTEITGGASQISGNFTVEETEDLANVLSSGKMPAPIRIISYEVIGE